MADVSEFVCLLFFIYFILWRCDKKAGGKWKTIHQNPFWFQLSVLMFYNMLTYCIFSNSKNVKSITSWKVIHLYWNAYFALSTMNILTIPVYCYLHILVFVPLLVFIFLAFRRFVFDLVLRHHFVPFNNSTSLKNGIDVIS